MEMEGTEYESTSYETNAFLTEDDRSSLVMLATTYPGDVLYIGWDGYEPANMRIQEVHITTTKASAVTLQIMNGNTAGEPQTVSFTSPEIRTMSDNIKPHFSTYTVKPFKFHIILTA